jgi:nucleotide-binding universal stress UspA family protein
MHPRKPRPGSGREDRAAPELTPGAADARSRGPRRTLRLRRPYVCGRRRAPTARDRAQRARTRTAARRSAGRRPGRLRPVPLGTSSLAPAGRVGGGRCHLTETVRIARCGRSSSRTTTRRRPTGRSDGRPSSPKPSVRDSSSSASRPRSSCRLPSRRSSRRSAQRRSARHGSPSTPPRPSRRGPISRRVRVPSSTRTNTQSARDLLAERKVQAELVEPAVEDAADAVVSLAASCEADIVVLAAHPPTMWQRLFGQSLAAEVSRRISCDLFIVA